MLIPTELPIGGLTAIQDSREQCPVDLHPLRTVVGTLTTGDYSIVGLEQVVAIERKSLDDLLGCIGQQRERFDKEVQRLAAYHARALVVEASWQDIERGEWRSKVTPSAALGSLLGWAIAGLPIVMAGSHERAGRYIARLLVTAARRRWREAKGLLGAVEQEPAPRSRFAYPAESVASFDATSEAPAND
jgi:ERCC4-type nuclease